MTPFTSAYLPPVEWYAAMVASGCHDLDRRCRYSRQRNVNRCTILMPDGPQTLTIPLVAESTHATIGDLRISDHGRWRAHHWNALQTAYGKSPFFEYYADDFRPFYTDHWTCLADFNEALHATVCRLLDITTLPRPNTAQAPVAIQPYYQVFMQRIGFKPGMSIVDLLFNMGPEGIFILLGREL